MESFWHDLKFGLRVLLSKRTLTIVALLALALGIGANTAVFSILYSTLWKRLPYSDADRLAIVWETRAEQKQNVVSPANYADWKEKNRVFEDIAAFAQFGGVSLTGDEAQPEEIPVQYVTPNLFHVLGVRPVIGRDFTERDGIGEDITVILSNSLWRRRYRSDPKITERQILINGRKANVAGVMPPEWGWFVKEGSMFGKAPEIWMAFPITPEVRVQHGRYLTTVARLKQDVSFTQAQTNADLIAKQLAHQYPDRNANWGIRVVPLREQFYGNLRKPLWILSGAVAFVLLIACMNVANLMLVRAVSRSKEIALRSCLGASRGRLVRQLLTENIVLSVAGGALGILLAVWGTQSLSLLAGTAGIDLGPAHLDFAVLLFALLLSVFTGLFFGSIPSAIASQWNLPEQLKENSRVSSGLHLGKIRNALVIVQLAVALVLLSGAALLIQSFWKVSGLDPGFRTRSALTFRIQLPSIKYPEDAQRIQTFRNIVGRVRGLPGVKAAGMVSYLPFGGQAAGTAFHIQGVADPLPGQERITNVLVVDNGFFQALQIPLVKGRLFRNEELLEHRNVVLINEALARQYFPNEDPIGRKITIDMKSENIPSEIAGIVGNVKQLQLDDPARPSVYWPYPELTYRFMTIVAHTHGDPLSVLPAVRQTIHSIDPNQPIADIHTMEELLGNSNAKIRFNMVLLAVLASIALVLAVAGVYGVMSHAVSQRTQEVGIRMTLGADNSDILKMVLKDGWRILLTGAVTGTLAAAILTRFMQSLLFETSTTDPLVFLSVIALLILSGLIACWIPSRRATAVTPMEALRYE